MHVQSLSWRPCPIAGQLERLHVIQQIGQRDPGLQPRQGHPPAKVNALLESQVRIGPRAMSNQPASLNCCGSRLAEPIITSTRLPAGIVWPCIVVSCSGDPHHPLQWRTITQDFLDGRGQEGHLPAQAGKLLWMLNKAEHRVN